MLKIKEPDRSEDELARELDMQKNGGFGAKSDGKVVYVYNLS